MLLWEAKSLSGFKFARDFLSQLYGTVFLGPQQLNQSNRKWIISMRKRDMTYSTLQVPRELQFRQSSLDRTIYRLLKKTAMHRISLNEIVEIYQFTLWESTRPG